jgi:hypothetical protein
MLSRRLFFAPFRGDHAAPIEVTTETIRRHGEQRDHGCIRGMVWPSGKWGLALQRARILKLQSLTKLGEFAALLIDLVDLRPKRVNNGPRAEKVALLLVFEAAQVVERVNS